MAIEVVESPLFFQHRSVSRRSSPIYMSNLHPGQMGVVVEGPGCVGELVMGFYTPPCGYAVSLHTGRFFNGTDASAYRVIPFSPSDAVTFVCK